MTALGPGRVKTQMAWVYSSLINSNLKRPL